MSSLGFEKSRPSGSSSGLVPAQAPARTNFLWPFPNSPREFLLVTGSASYFLVDGSSFRTCTGHNWSACSSAGQARGEWPHSLVKYRSEIILSVRIGKTLCASSDPRPAGGLVLRKRLRDVSLLQDVRFSNGLLAGAAGTSAALPDRAARRSKGCLIRRRGGGAIGLTA